MRRHDAIDAAKRHGEAGTAIDATGPAADSGPRTEPEDATPPCPADISSAQGQSCPREGQTCGGPCTNPCEFCNFISCSGGVWVGAEAAPEPCDAEAPSPDAAACTSDSDCRLFADYCPMTGNGCQCEALSSMSADPVCEAGVQDECLHSPCDGHTAACDQSGHCFVR